MVREPQTGDRLCSSAQAVAHAVAHTHCMEFEFTGHPLDAVNALQRAARIGIPVLLPGTLEVHRHGGGLNGAAEPLGDSVPVAGAAVAAPNTPSSSHARAETVAKGDAV